MITIGASQARKDFFNMLLAVRKGQTFDITYKDEVVAEVKSKKREDFDLDDYRSVLNKARKLFVGTDWNEWKKIRKKMNKRRFPKW